jgi:hypothetical protein
VHPLPVGFPGATRHGVIDRQVLFCCDSPAYPLLGKSADFLAVWNSSLSEPPTSPRRTLRAPRPRAPDHREAAHSPRAPPPTLDPVARIPGRATPVSVYEHGVDQILADLKTDSIGTYPEQVDTGSLIQQQVHNASKMARIPTRPLRAGRIWSRCTRHGTSLSRPT